MNEKEYIKQIEKQNEILQKLAEENSKRADDMEKLISMFDYIPTFIVYNDIKRKSLSSSTNSLFVHQCLESAYEILLDEIWSIVDSDVRELKGKFRRSLKTIGMIYMEAWFLSSRQRVYEIHVVSCPKPRGKYYLFARFEENKDLFWDETADNFYLEKVPKDKEVILKRLCGDIADCKELSKYINIDYTREHLEKKEK